MIQSGGEPQRSASQSINSKVLTTTAYQHIKVPEQGTPITVNEDHSLNVPNTPIIPYIEGDGIGIDISPVMIKVVDAAVEKAFGGEKKIAWMEIYTLPLKDL